MVLFVWYTYFAYIQISSYQYATLYSEFTEIMDKGI